MSRLEEILEEHSKKMDREIEDLFEYSRNRVFGAGMSRSRIEFYKSAVLREIEFLYNDWKSIRTGNMYCIENRDSCAVNRKIAFTVKTEDEPIVETLATHFPYESSIRLKLPTPNVWFNEIGNAGYENGTSYISSTDIEMGSRVNEIEPGSWEFGNRLYNAFDLYRFGDRKSVCYSNENSCGGMTMKNRKEAVNYLMGNLFSLVRKDLSRVYRNSLREHDWGRMLLEEFKKL